ncbi:hypothetical protein TIFTF001_013903 [Ficus carica]|uniref:Uncharacterized protein n=1 Tax=Ficus carica TaxID=3494 RepID=A0AA88A554_FICCA|nr:hypothetical protein TIFTF001_013903 [Ficus carica]
MWGRSSYKKSTSHSTSTTVDLCVLQLNWLTDLMADLESLSVLRLLCAKLALKGGKGTLLMGAAAVLRRLKRLNVVHPQLGRKMWTILKVPMGQSTVYWAAECWPYLVYIFKV